MAPASTSPATLLKHFKICCTGLEESNREKVRKWTETLGGSYSEDLAKDCTHLVAGIVHKSEKYKMALKMKIPIVRMDWLEDCWNRWHAHSGPIDNLRKIIVQLVKKYPVKMFAGCTISVTNVAFEERAKLGSLISQNGGIYSPDLGPNCTHLIYEQASAAENSQNLTSLPVKVQFAFKWNIPVVLKSWIYECTDLEKLLDESDFDPFKVESNNNNLLKDDSFLVTQSSQFPVNLEEITDDTPSFLAGLHIYLGDLTNNTDRNRNLILKRLVIAAGGARYTDFHGHLTHIIIHNQLLPSELTAQLTRFYADSETMPKVVHDRWLFECFLEKKRIPTGPFEINLATFLPQPNKVVEKVEGNGVGKGWQRITTTVKQDTGNSSFLNANDNSFLGTANAPDFFFSSTPNLHAGHKNESINASTNLEGSTFYFHPSLQKGSSGRIKKLTLKLVKLGAVISEQWSGETWCIVPVLMTRKAVETLKLPKGRMRTEFWVEECLEKGKLLLESGIDWYSPVISESPNLPLSSFSKRTISQTGFTGWQREFYAQIIKFSGAVYTDNLTKGNTDLVIAAKQGTKYEYARKYGIKCIESGDFIGELRAAGSGKRLDEHKEQEEQNDLITRKRGRSQLFADEESFKLTFESVNSNSSSNNNDNNSIVTAGAQVVDAEMTRLSLDDRTKDSRKIMAKNRTQSALITEKLVSTPVKNSFIRKIKEAADQLPASPLESNENAQIYSTVHTDPKEILKNLVFSVSQRLWHRRDELCDLVEEMGGRFAWTFDRHCTHYLHQGNQLEENFKEFRTAREGGKWIISPIWLKECRKMMRRVEEVNYPHTLKLNVTVDASDNAKLNDQMDFVSTEQAEQQPQVQGPSQGPPIDWEKLMAEKRAKDLQLRPGMKIDFNSHPLFTGVKDDKSFNVSGLLNPDEVEGENNGNKGNKGRNEVFVKFVFSGYQGGERTALSEIVKTLKGCDVLGDADKIEWHPEGTVLITEKAGLTEKFMAACASGCWILKKEYLEECERQNRLIDYDDYEIRPASNDDYKMSTMIAAARFWREHRLKTGRRACEGWRVFLAIDQDRQDIFRNVLIAGGASCVSTINDLKMNVNLESSTMIFSHLLFSSQKMISRVSEELLKRIPGDRHFSSKYLVDYIFTHGNPEQQ